ncbi:hypothetical protein EWM64_g8903 [Hericium alpestre]|uniref:Uncharacterized protein n=1 Tax=Hericium alpestre TaxID=135208 RepID=A0A4Y9ZNV5_9AGAM|nr:hypothetical protein EWM64_g8903 [Hericium alpestre]
MAHSLQLLIDDTSPALFYYPFSDTLGFPDLAAGWNPYFTDSGFAVTLGEVGNGTSFHTTSCDGAAFSVQWFGSGIQLFGNVTGAATYDLTLDGQTNSSISSFSSDATLLASYEDLQPANHTLSLIVHNPNNLTSSRIAIDSAVISVTTASQNPNATLLESVVEDTDLAFKGEWSYERDPTFTSGDTTFHTSTNAGDLMIFAFNGTAVAVNGFRDAQSGQYSVTLDNQTRVLDGRSSFKEHATLFFATGLDPTMPHQIAVINNESRLLSIGSVNVTSVANPFQPMAASSSGLSKGTIAAAVVASVLGFLVLCLFLLFAWRRRHRLIVLRRRRMLSPSQKAADVGGIIDIHPDAEDDRREDKDKDYVYHTKEGSVSFTLDLPIQTRSSPRENSDNGIQPEIDT